MDDPESTELIDCPAEAVGCTTELEVDWYTRGEQGYTIRRYCSEEKHTECDEGLSERVRFKDCYDDCDGDGCNIGLDVQEEFEDGDQKMCEVCYYRETADGEVLGNKNCQDPDALPETKDSGECPRWANLGCYTGTAQAEADGVWLHEVARGCSSFITDGLVEYEDTDEVFGLTYAITKESCTGENCNLGSDAPDIPDPTPDENTFACYKCKASYKGVDHIEGDPHCLDNPEDGELVACPQERCTTELLTDWYTRGDQGYTIRRDCDPEPSNPECEEGFNERIKFKDCFEDCETSRCNNDMAVAEKFENGKQDTCEVCFYRENLDGDVEGNYNCQDPDAIGTRDIFTCPRWANVGCYTGTSQTEMNGELLHEVARGCSSFTTDGLVEYEAEEEGFSFSITKESCTGTNCNLVSDAPDIPDPTPDEDTFACYKCKASYKGFDLIEGDPHCLDNPEDGELVACSAERCTTELITDWYTRGEQGYIVRRDCDPEPSNPECEEGFNEHIKFKDCYEDCETSRCNNDLAVAEKFDNGKQDTCEVCFYRETLDGDVEGNTNCQDPDAREARDIMDCPRWANVGCFTGTAQTQIGDIWLHEVSRGCSSFITDGLVEYEADEEGYNYAITKESCTGTNCNLATDAPDIPGGDGESGAATYAVLSPLLALIMSLFN